MKVSDMMRIKGSALFTAQFDTPLHEALATMAENDMGSVVVMQHGALVGMLTFREVINTVHRKPEAYRALTVGRVMQADPARCTPETDVDEVRRIMLESHARYMPVMDGSVLMGVISFYDVAKAVVDSQGFENQMLKAYIRDWPVDGESTFGS